MSDLPTVEDALAAVEAWHRVTGLAYIHALIEGYAETLGRHVPGHGNYYCTFCYLPEPEVRHDSREVHMRSWPCLDATSALRSLAPLVRVWKEATGA